MCGSSFEQLAVVAAAAVVSEQPAAVADRRRDRCRLRRRNLARHCRDEQPIAVVIGFIVGIGIGKIFGSAAEATARQPEAANEIRSTVNLPLFLLEGVFNEFIIKVMKKILCVDDEKFIHSIKLYLIFWIVHLN